MPSIWGKRLPGAAHKVSKEFLKRKFFRDIKTNFTMAYGGNVNGVAVQGAVPHPINFYDSNMSGLSGTKAKVRAVVRTVRVRGFNGPELNFFLFGVPFLLNTAVGTIHSTVNKPKPTRIPKNRADGAAPIALKLKTKAATPDELVTTPLPMDVVSDQMVSVRQTLVSSGMKVETATALVTGKIVGDLADSLDEADLQAFLDSLDVNPITS